ncbi:MAG: hypothetical protein IKV64_01045 [Clostridia bacterium]|nr:hypothetical protein [Clostridia bacterium]
MAEKYGEVPPRFTKKWWEYFWDYYKWHTVTVICIIAAIVLTVVQIKNREEYDLNILVGTYSHMTTESVESLTNELEEKINDVDANGESNIMLLYNGFSDSVEQREYDSVMKARFSLYLQEDKSFIFIVDEQSSQLLLDIDYCDEMYVPSSELVSNTDGGLKGADGVVYGIPLKNSTLLKKHKINGENLYLILRESFKDNTLNTKAFDESLKLVEELIK